jgi:curli biogenesis system outer membrane secretion channel CsgG
MIMPKLSLVVSLMGLYLSMVSCSLPVVSRQDSGFQERDTPIRHNFGGVKKKVALLTFFNESPQGGDDLGVVATEELRSELARTGEFVIDPMAARSFGNSKEIYAGGGSKLVQLSRQARIQGINLVIFGRIIEARVRENTDEIGLVRKTKSYTESQIELRIFDIGSNREIFVETLRGYADDSTFRLFSADRETQLQYRRDLMRYGVRVAMRRAVPSILEVATKLDWIGRVAKIVGNRIYINAGRSSGINIGDILRVMTEGSEIYDPETGALIGTAKGEVKGTLEIIDYFGPDGSIAVLHSGGSVLEGDFVTLY